MAVGDDEKEVAFREEFDIAATASFILRNGFERVALQFPDELLKDSVAVSSALSKEISNQKGSVRLFVMADTTFGSCCADEVAAMHVDAQCIVHYGHTCLSVTSRLPVWFVFGRATINAESCANCIVEFAAGKKQPILIMFGLRHLYDLHSIQEKIYASQEKDLDITFAHTPSQLMEPSVTGEKSEKRCQGSKSTSGSSEQYKMPKPRINSCCQSGQLEGINGKCNTNHTDTCCSTSNVAEAGMHKYTAEGLEFNVGGLKWVVPADRNMEDYVILWIGGDDPGLTNVSLIFNSSTIVRYDDREGKIVTDVAKHSRLLQRRYYLVERAKDANVVGIVVGTLGVAGYGEMIQRIRKIIKAAGKKPYTLVIGKPNPYKLANFPECEIFVLVACPQTALLDSKDYLAPILTPFEAELAFVEGKQWTGAYKLDFAREPASDFPAQGPQESSNAEPRFSFFRGSYVAEGHSQDTDADDEPSRAVVLSCASQHALDLRSKPSLSIISTERSVLDIKSGAEYLAFRTYQGLDINQEGPRKVTQAVIGRKGRAAGYKDERTN